MNRLEKDYKMFLALDAEEAYEKEIGDGEKLEQAQKNMSDFMEGLMEDKDYEELFGMYVRSMQNENEALNITDGCRVKMATFAKMLNEYGIDKFTLTDNGSDVIKKTWTFTQCGYELKGVKLVNYAFDPMGDENDNWYTTPALVFEKG